MSNLTFIRYKKGFEHMEDFRTVFVTASEIETLNVSETYGDYGQQVGHYYAGDYHFDNSDSSAIQDCTKALQESGLIDKNCMIEFYYQNDYVEVEVSGDNEVCNIEEIQNFVKDWREENEVLTTCHGFNYWDGSNHKTIVSSSELDEFGLMYEIIESNEVEEKGYNEAIESMKLIANQGGYQTWESDNYFIIQSAHSSNPWAYEITEK